MAETLLNVKLTELIEEVKQLKSDLDYPRLNISRFFRNIRNEIDITYAKLKLAAKSIEQKAKLVFNWNELIERINQFERQCLENLIEFSESVKKESMETLELIDSCLMNLIKQNSALNETIKPGLEKFNIEMSRFFVLPIVNSEDAREKNEKNSNLLRMMSQSSRPELERSLSYDTLDNEEYLELCDLVYDEKNRIERILFQNNTMFFINRSIQNEENKNLFAKLDPDTTGGILLFLTNEYFGQHATDYFKNPRTKRITNEIIKIRKIRKQLLREPISNQFEAIKFDFGSISICDFSGAQLKRFTSNLFRDFTNMKKINFYNNQVIKIDANVFNNMMKLEKLDLSFNQISMIESKPFEGSASLTHINLANNQLRTIDSNAFRGLINLMCVDLSDNELFDLDTNLFEGLASLKEIDLKWNNLTRIKPATFKGLFKLQMINLSGNPLTFINQTHLRNYSEMGKDSLFRLPILF